jgi:uncharacterized protein YoxC
MLRVPFIASAFAILALIIVVLVIALLQGQRHLRGCLKKVEALGAA